MMRYCAIDVETTGVDPERCQVLDLACVIETDWLTPVDRLPTFHRLCNPGEIRGEAIGLSMNARLISELAAAPKTPPLTLQLIDLSGFIQKHLGDGSVTIAGKNFGGFDYQFLRRDIQWVICMRHKHRFIDVGSMWWNPAEDECLPDLATCHARAGFSPRPRHDAAQDCYSVIECVRAFYRRGAK